MIRAAVSRADLLRALVAAGPSGAVDVGLMGFERRKLAEPPPLPVRGGTGRIEQTLPTEEPAERRLIFPHVVRGQRSFDFVTPVALDVLRPEPSLPGPIASAVTDDELAVPRYVFTSAPPLVPWSRLGIFLRRRLGIEAPGRRIDLDRLSRMAASGLPWKTVPRLPRQCWASETTVLWDTSLEMEPYVPDVAELVRRLKRERGRVGLHVRKIKGPPLRVSGLPPQAPVLLLSAMGQLNGDEATVEGWANLGRRLLWAGHPLTALTPCPIRLRQSAVAAVWPCAIWDRFPRLPRDVVRQMPLAECSAPTAARRISPEAESLLDLLSPATLVRPALLRHVRMLLSPVADVGTEYEAWFHPHSTGSLRHFNLRPGLEYEARLARAAAAAERPDTAMLVRQAATLISKNLRRTCCSVVAAEADLRTCLSVPGRAVSLEKVTELLERVVERLRDLADFPGSAEGGDSGLATWFQRMSEERLTDAMRRDLAVSSLVARGLALAKKFLGQLESVWPPGLDAPAALAELRSHARRGPAQPVKSYRVGLRGSAVVLELETAAPEPGFVPLGILEAAQPWLHVVTDAGQTATQPQCETISLTGGNDRAFVHSVADLGRFSLETDCHRLHFEPKRRPIWADRMWYDRGGIAAQFAGAGTLHVMRWRAPEKVSGVEALHEPLSSKGRWQAETTPSWTEKLWVGRFGLATEFRIGAVPFVLRWIPPGRFLMGSPGDEPGRYGDEGPRHEVTISRGFWLGETPVTQAQWKAVVAEAAKNRPLLEKWLKRTPLKPEPSHFQGPDALPVESVNWTESALFCRILTNVFEARLPPGFGFRLPTEAQWEYACRAGAETALYTGGITIKGENHAPELDAIAWYGGNSGRELEVKNPYDSTSFPNKQYDDAKAGTHQVKLKKPNDLGLYDMLGNVWEWCSDAWNEKAYERKENEMIDPVETASDEGASRVVRGGSWSVRARDCRAACRYHGDPGFRDGRLGLRLSAGQEPGAAEPPGAERPSGSRRRSRG